LEKITDSFEIIIAEDGSTDGTDEIAKKLSEKYPFIKSIHSDKRQGSGKALRRAFMMSNGEIIAYMDVDLATDLKHLKSLIDYIREGYDISTGSRMVKGSDVKRELIRSIASIVFNFLVRTLLGSKINDHQCGFKAFRRSSLFDILGDAKDDGWFFVAELLVIAQRRGYRIIEFPVKWRAGTKTRVNLKKDVFEMMKKIFKLRKKLKNM